MLRQLAGSTAMLAVALSATGCIERIPEEGAAQSKGKPAAQVAEAAEEAPDTGPAPNAPKLAPGIVNPLVSDAPTGKYGGSLALYAYEDPKTFNPVMSKDGTSARFIAYVFDGLVGEDGVSFEVTPALAESWTVAPDGKTYTFKLRQGVTWHDGKPFTADDVVFTWMTVLRNTDVPWDARDGLRIDGQLPVVTKLDERTVQFKLPRAFAPFMRSAGLSILPRHVFEPWLAAGKDGKPKLNSQWGVDADVTKIVGTGAWQFDSYAPGQRIVLKRNPNYYVVNRHKQPLPYFDKMTIPFMKNLDRAILAFDAGETDAQWLPGKDVTYMKPKEKEGNFRIYNGGPDFRTSFLTFNLNPGKNAAGKPYVDPAKLKWFADTRFRQALSYGIDREALIINVYRRMAVPQNSPIFQKSPFYDPTVPQYDYDPAKAEQLLAEAGFVKKGGTLFDASGKPVKFEMLMDVGSKEGEMSTNMIKEDWKKLGIDMKIQPVTFNLKITRTHETKDWEASTGAWGAGVEPHGVNHLWQSHGQAHVFNLDPSETLKKNPTYAWEKRIDELFEQGAVTVDEAKRKKIYNEFQHIVMREQPMIFLPVFFYTVAVRNTVGNVRPSAYSNLGVSWNSYELYRK